MPFVYIYEFCRVVVVVVLAFTDKHYYIGTFGNNHVGEKEEKFHVSVHVAWPSVCCVGRVRCV